jgi:hypothetical protein
MIDIDIKPDRKKLGTFGWITTGIFLTFSIIFFINTGVLLIPLIALVTAIYGLIGAIVQPNILKPFYITLICLSFPIGWVVSNLILTLIFFLGFFPMGLLLRLKGHDPLRKRFGKIGESSWIESNRIREAKTYYQQH